MSIEEKAKTVEQVADDIITCTCDESYLKRDMWAPDCPRHSSACEEAMTEYAKQMSIAFVKWTTEREWYYDVEDNQYFHNHFTDLYTPEEMYNLFIQDQQK